METDRALLIFAALNGAIGVGLGAFAAHGAGPEAKALLAAGGHYQMVHAALGAACALAAPIAPPARGRVRLAGWLAAGGGLVFCLSLAGIALLGVRALGAVAPAGGTLMIAGWLMLALGALRALETKNA